MAEAVISYRCETGISLHKQAGCQSRGSTLQGLAVQDLWALWSQNSLGAGGGRKSVVCGQSCREYQREKQLPPIIYNYTRQSGPQIEQSLDASEI